MDDILHIQIAVTARPFLYFVLRSGGSVLRPTAVWHDVLH